MNLALWLERAGRSYGGLPALGHGPRVVKSYSELAQAAAEIAASLRRGKRSEQTRKAEDSLQNRLVEFEAAYPQLAGIVTRLLDGLAQLGI